MDALETRATVLAIDDSPPVLSLLAARLKHEAITLLTAKCGESGFRVALAKVPDLILLDVDMPDESGIEWCRRFKEHPTTANIPVVFLTASEDVTTKVSGFDVGAMDYVVKSCHPAELRARVRAALRLKRVHDLLAERALVDSLTGLHNRAYFDGRLQTELAATRRAGKPLSLVFIDLDHFKLLNDAFGHPFGDEVLRRSAELFVEVAPRREAVCRLGGEELAMLLPGASIADAEALADRARARLAETVFTSRGERVEVTASFGVAEASELAPRNGELTARALVTAADEALYAAKRGGRNRVCRTHQPVALKLAG